MTDKKFFNIKQELNAITIANTKFDKALLS